MDVQGKNVLVSGANGGIGGALVAELMARGAAKVYAAARNVAAVEPLVRQSGGRVVAVPLDVTDAGSVARALDQCPDTDILINNAGVSSFAALDAGDEYEAIWHRAIAVMLTAHQRMVRAALPWLRKSDAARIVNIASTEGLGATPGDTPYVAAKTGVTGLTRGLAVDLGREGITVNCICPGPIRTGMTDKVPEEDKAVFAKRRTALRRYGEPEEVAHMTLSVVLPAASYITGAVIPVDGGLGMGH